MTAFVPKDFNIKLSYKDYIFRTINSVPANQNDVIKNFAVVMSGVIKRVECTDIYIDHKYLFTEQNQYALSQTFT